MSADVTMETHAKDVANVLFFEDLHEVVLVGHSYAGIIITLAAELCHRRIKHLVYLDAMVPIDGRPRVDLMTPDAANSIRSHRQGDVWTHPPLALGLRPDRGDELWFVDRLVPQPAMDIDAPIHLGPRWEAIRRTYITCTESPVHLFADDTIAGANWERVEIYSDHFPMLYASETLADALHLLS